MKYKIIKTPLNLDQLINLFLSKLIEWLVHGITAVQYKSKKRTELVKNGYIIVGDQWSDLIGENVGNRTFKVPDPMYYVA